MSMKTTVTNLEHPRYTDESYPGNQIGEFGHGYRPNQLRTAPGTYYEISFWGVYRQYDKYRALKKTVASAIEYVLEHANGIEPLSSDVRDLKHWFHSPYGFTCQHMPWRVLLDGELYTPLVYVLVKHDTSESRAAYHTIRRYGRWV